MTNKTLDLRSKARRSEDSKNDAEKIKSIGVTVKQWFNIKNKKNTSTSSERLSWKIEIS